MRREGRKGKARDNVPPHLSELNEAARRRSALRSDLGIERRSLLVTSPAEGMVVNAGRDYTLARLF